MDELPDFIEYLSASRPLIMFGAGASSSAGLPTWGKLAEKILERLRLEKPKDVEPVEELFAKNNLPEMFGAAQKVFGSLSALCSACKEELREPSSAGEVYALIAKLPSIGFLTTNFDSLLASHFRESRLAHNVLLNSKTQLELVDFDVPRTIVKLHGDFSDESHIVLTDRQYEDVLAHPRFESLRRFVSSHLHTSRMIFIGYSFSDPDLQLLLSEAAKNLRREVPLYAILADISDKQTQYLFDIYNIKVLKYKAPKGDHSELAKLLQIAVTYFSSKPYSSGEVNFSAAQSLYMWHKMKSDDAIKATHEALQAIILGALAAEPDGLTRNGLRSSMSGFVSSLDSTKINPALDVAIDALVEKGLVAPVKNGISVITKPGATLQGAYSNQFINLRSSFAQQVLYDLEAVLPDIKDPVLRSYQARVDAALMQIFSERGAELADSAFSERFETRGSLDLLKTINAFTSDLPDGPRSAMFSYIMSLVVKPREDQRAYLEFLAKAFFTSQVVGIDPEGATFRNFVFESRSVILDANVLIPAVAKSSAKYKYFRECLEIIKSAGIKLVTIEPFIDEMVWHFNWALNFVKQYGEKSLELLECAIGSPEFRRNEGIDGFVRMAADRDISFDEYYLECFGAPLSYAAVKKLIGEMGVEIFSLNEIASSQKDIWVIQDEMDQYISELQAGLEFPKSPSRIRGEAYAFAVCYGWNAIRPDNVPEELWHCSLLSQGMYLNKIAKSGPYPLSRPIVVRPDALVEAIKTFQPGEQKFSVGDAMLATYVRSAAHFIDKRRYTEFFKPLIADSEKTYYENLHRFDSLVETNSDVDLLDQYEPLDKPLVVSSLRRISLAERERALLESQKELERIEAETQKALNAAERERQRSADLAELALRQLSSSARKRVEREVEKKFDNE